MKKKSLPDLMQDELPSLFKQLVKCGVTASPIDEADLNRQSLAVCTQLSGTLRGPVVFAYPKKGREALIRQFLATAAGGAEVECTDKAVCLELSNIILGHFTETARQAGYPTAIDQPGTIHSAPSLAADCELPEFQSGTGTWLKLESEDDRLGTFYFWYNLSISATCQEEPAGEAKARVLIVDDSPVMRAFLEKVFRQNGYEVVGTAADGVEAIEKFEATNPDLMTLDIIMPKLKGTDVLEKILESHPEAKVIMASSVSDARTVMNCLKIGAKRYILKPYDTEAVMGAVEKVLKIQQ